METSVKPKFSKLAIVSFLLSAVPAVTYFLSKVLTVEFHEGPSPFRNFFNLYFDIGRPIALLLSLISGIVALIIVLRRKMRGKLLLLLTTILIALSIAGGLPFFQTIPAVRTILKNLPPPDPNPDLLLITKDGYQRGTTAKMEIKNLGNLIYSIPFGSPACSIAILDSKRREVDPPLCGDAIELADLYPGQSMTFDLRLDECAGLMNFGGCSVRRPLPPGTYTLRGRFNGSKYPSSDFNLSRNVQYKITIIEKPIVIQ